MLEREQTYLVTGVAGFIASVVARQLLAAGHTVVGIDNLNDYYDVRLKNHRLKELRPSDSFEFVHLDIEDREGLRELFDKHAFDAVINLAARAGVRYSMVDPHVYMTTNAMGTLNLLEEMRRCGTRKMVLASTSSLYAGLPMPFKEDLPVNSPISPYAASKKAAEAMAYSYHFLYGLDISVVRYFTVYGPAGRPDMSIFRFIRWIDEGKPIELFGDGTQSRDFTYVDDIASGTIAAIRSLGYEVVNLGGGNNPISINYVIETIGRLLEKQPLVEQKPFHKADMKETWANIDKAGRLLQWAPTVSLEEGLQRTVDWYRSGRDWLLDIKL